MTSCQYKQSTEQYALFKKSSPVQRFFSKINTYSFIEFIPNFTNALYMYLVGFQYEYVLISSFFFRSVRTHFNPTTHLQIFWLIVT
jgi:hypothetical protein